MVSLRINYTQIRQFVHVTQCPSGFPIASVACRLVVVRPLPMLAADEAQSTRTVRLASPETGLPIPVRHLWMSQPNCGRGFRTSLASGGASAFRRMHILLQREGVRSKMHFRNIWKFEKVRKTLPSLRGGPAAAPHWESEALSPFMPFPGILPRCRERRLSIT